MSVVGASSGVEVAPLKWSGVVEKQARGGGAFAFQVRYLEVHPDRVAWRKEDDEREARSQPLNKFTSLQRCGDGVPIPTVQCPCRSSSNRLIRHRVWQ